MKFGATHAGERVDRGTVGPVNLEVDVRGRLGITAVSHVTNELTGGHQAALVDAGSEAERRGVAGIVGSGSVVVHVVVAIVPPVVVGDDQAPTRSDVILHDMGDAAVGDRHEGLQFRADDVDADVEVGSNVGPVVTPTVGVVHGPERREDHGAHWPAAGGNGG